MPHGIRSSSSSGRRAQWTMEVVCVEFYFFSEGEFLFRGWVTRWRITCAHTLEFRKTPKAPLILFLSLDM